MKLAVVVLLSIVAYASCSYSKDPCEDKFPKHHCGDHATCEPKKYYYNCHCDPCYAKNEEGMCSLLTCSAPASPSMGYFTPALGPHYCGKKVDFKCKKGYFRVGSATKTCTQDGTSAQFEPKGPVMCKPIPCGAPGGIDNGKMTVTRPSGSNPTAYPVTTKVVYKCNFGYELVGKDTLDCLVGPMWSYKPPICRLKKCARPAVPVNGYIDPDQTSYAVGVSVMYMCEAEYYLDGVDERTCLLGQIWGGQVPTCKPKPCSTPGTPTNGFISNPFPGGKYPIGYALRYRCDKGYQITSSYTTVTCLLKPKWSDVPPKCGPIPCDMPGIAINSKIVALTYPAGQTQGYPVGTVVEYKCNFGYETTDSLVAQCKLYKIWSEKPPVCTEIRCSRPMVPAIVIITQDKTSYSVGSTVAYSCPADYRLEDDTGAKCQLGGTWDKEDPKCVLITCPNPMDDDVKGPKVIYDANTIKPAGEDYLPGDIVTGGCEIQYSPNFEGIMKCVRRGNYANWEHMWKCEKGSCKDRCTGAYFVPSMVGRSYGSGDDVFRIPCVCDRLTCKKRDRTCCLDYNTHCRGGY